MPNCTCSDRADNGVALVAPSQRLLLVTVSDPDPDGGAREINWYPVVAIRSHMHARYRGSEVVHLADFLVLSNYGGCDRIESLENLLNECCVRNYRILPCDWPPADDKLHVQALAPALLRGADTTDNCLVIPAREPYAFTGRG
jgi:hypothetical protein